MTAVTPGREELPALADQIERYGITVYGPWHPYETVKQMIVGVLRRAAKPYEDGERCQ